MCIRVSFQNLGRMCFQRGVFLQEDVLSCFHYTARKIVIDYFLSSGIELYCKEISTGPVKKLVVVRGVAPQVAEKLRHGWSTEKKGGEITRGAIQGRRSR